MREMKIYIGHGELDKYLLQAKKANELLSYIHRVKLKIYNDTGHTIPEPKKEELINIIKFFLS